MNNMVVCIAIIICTMFCFITYGTEKETTIPIIGGFGVKLGEVFDNNMINKLKAVKVNFKENENIIGYKFKLNKTLKGFNSCTVLLNKDKKIYQIQLLSITIESDNIFSNAVYYFQKKYGLVSNITNQIMFIDKNKKTRSVKIFKGDAYVGIIYLDTSITNSENNVDI